MTISSEINTPNGPAVNSPYGPVLLSDLFEADIEKGVLRWRARPVGHFLSKHACNAWNARFAGALALSSIIDQGYHHGTVFGVTTIAHRVLFAMRYGYWPSAQVDHISGIRSDNRACNLRAASKAENQKNLAIGKANTSGVMGVSWHKSNKKWQAYIKSAGKSIYLGLFDDIESATLARKAEEEKLGFHPNHGRRARPMEC